jgi:hypothetical protein
VNVLVTSHAAQLAAAATAHVLACLVAPFDTTAAQALCPQQQAQRLRIGSCLVEPCQGVRLRMHASLTGGDPQGGTASQEACASEQKAAAGEFRWGPC